MLKDSFGPEYVVDIYDPSISMEGFLVIDNTTLGPGKGGIRMSANVTLVEVARLARTMTWKNALAGLPFGGAKTGIVWRGGTDALKRKYVESFARAIRPFVPHLYIAGPDVGTGEKEMGWFVHAIRDPSGATGKPATLCARHPRTGKKACGLPHELGSTGFGVAEAVAIAAEARGMPLRGARIAIHGFGNVGIFTYRFLAEKGARIVALADRGTALHCEEGVDHKKIENLIMRDQPLAHYPSEAHIPANDFWKIPVDILIPASVTDVIKDENKRDISAAIIVEGGNIPMSESIEEELVAQGILIIPDIVANAGGVISSYAEYRGLTPESVFPLIRRKIGRAVREVLAQSARRKTTLRHAALSLARKRIEAHINIRKRHTPPVRNLNQKDAG